MPAAKRRRDAVTIIDETVLLRYLLDDDAAKSARARSLVLGGNVRVYPETIVRTVCVLTEVYGVPRSLVGNVVELLLDDVSVEDEASVRLAARLFGSGKLDFDACLASARSTLHGYQTYSFARPSRR
ncbi:MULTISPECIES: PIN domain-containing protein [unclassified Adlercreutzia]|uniref:PIN domain-containing protein n=1 Tax=unclassified Adlercreutzia TaxID=2636013 RepID=UPI0013E9F488|nr:MULTISPECIES: type II toxin-antitoxin system VapC family toxin [unclassified Adlercreutzia]